MKKYLHYMIAGFAVVSLVAVNIGCSAESLLAAAKTLSEADKASTKGGQKKPSTATTAKNLKKSLNKSLISTTSGSVK